MKEPVQRTLALSETCLIERDPSTYAIVTLQPLASVFALVRYDENPQNFAIEYNTGIVRRYTSADRYILYCNIIVYIFVEMPCCVLYLMVSEPLVTKMYVLR